MAKAKKKETEHNLPPKKTLKVVKSPTHPLLFKIVYHEGGNVPKELSGTYNKVKLADKAITEYLKNNRTYIDHVRDKENAKKQDETGV